MADYKLILLGDVVSDSGGKLLQPVSLEPSYEYDGEFIRDVYVEVQYIVPWDDTENGNSDSSTSD